MTLQNDIHTSANDVGIGSKHLNPVDPPLHSAGYLELNNTVDAKLFYFYAEVRLVLEAHALTSFSSVFVELQSSVFM